MRRFYVVALFACACGGREQQPREIFIDTVTGSNPLVVVGRARTFENTVQLRARDVAGALVNETFTTSVGEIGRHNPYEARLWLTRDPGEYAVVEAFEYSAEDGSVRSLTSRRVPVPGPRLSVRVAFPTSECTTVLEFERAVPRTAAVAGLLVHILVDGPTAAERSRGAGAPFPRGSIVDSVTLRDGVATVDFNDRLQNVGGACAAQAIRASVTETLMRLPAVKSVRIRAGGSEALALQP